ncbi:MAG TPA: hypothetical protein VGJ87_02140 [Roseiflexaceae bacterium]|jgi:hypothetical protein
MALFVALAEGIEQSGVFGPGELGGIVGHLIGLLLAGALFGLAQWRGLRRYVPRATWPVLGASAGLWLGYAAGYEIFGFPFDYILGPGLAAALAAVAQWSALRRQVAGAGWWVAASALGFMLGGIAGLVPAFLGLGEAIGTTYLGWIALNGLMGAINGAIGGAIAGAVLVRLLRRQATAPESAFVTTGAR